LSRFYDLNVFFFSPSNFTVALQDSLGGYSRPVTSASASSILDGVGSAEVTFPVISTYGELEVPGNIVILVYGDKWYPNAFFVGESYIIKEVETFTQPQGPEMVRLHCVSLLDELTKLQIWRPIGNENTTATTVSAALGAPISTTMRIGAPTNNDAVDLTSVAGVLVTDEIRITLNNGSVFVTRVTEGGLPGVPATVLKIKDRVPSNADAGNAVVVRHRRVKVAASAIDFLVGSEVDVTMTGGTHHVTIIDEEPVTTYDGAVDGFVFLRDALTLAVASGNAIETTNWNTVATNDIQQIMSYATGWTATLNGTASGSKFAPDGAGVLDLLMEASKISGEHFRLDINQSGLNAPIRRIKWIGFSEDSGNTGTLTIVVPNTPTDVAFYTTTQRDNTGIALNGITRRGRKDRVTRVYPFAGDEVITLNSVSPATLSLLSAAGYSVEINPATLGLYRAPNVYDAAQETALGRVQSKSVNFSDIRTESESPESILPAADMLAIEAMRYLDVHKAPYREFQIDGMLLNCAVPLKVGQRVELSFVQTPTGYWTESYGTGNELFVKSVNVRISAETGGIPLWDVVLANQIRPPEDFASSLAGRMKTLDSLARRGASGTVTILPGGSGGTGGSGVTDHGLLTGLLDNDHPGYVLASSTGAGLGLVYAAGQVLDLGTPTTLSATSANALFADTHTHALAAVSDGQTTPAELLKTTAGGRVRLTGLGLNTDQTSYALEVNGRINYRGVNELEFSGAGAAQIRNSGQLLTIAANDLILDPGTAILQVDGDITFTSAARTIRTNVGNLNLDPFSGLVVMDGNLQFTAGGKTISTAADTLKLAPVGELQFDSTANVTRIMASNALYREGFASGFLGTGWGIQYDGTADFRFLRADELHVMSFIADIARVSVGAHYVTPAMAELSRPFTIPAVSSTGTLYVNDVPGFPDSQVFADEDWVMIRTMDRSSGGLQAFLVWGQVSGYTDLTADEQSWTFTTRSANAAAVGEIGGAGLIALGFGKSGDGWQWTTAIGPDSPYMGITTWHGANPYTEGNRKHRIRIGQLVGVTGNYEWGLHAGVANSNRVIISDLRSELHGTRLSLYSNDNALFKVEEVEIRFTYNGATTADRLPTSDISNLQADSTGAAFWTQVSAGYDTPAAGSYINNEPGRSGEVIMGFADPPTWTTLNNVGIRIRHSGSAFSSDTVTLYAQIMRSDDMTPLTSEEIISIRTTNTSSGTGLIAFAFIDKTASASLWNNAHVRVRWEYAAVATAETIRLDPSVPSLGIGGTLPTGISSGGNGLWVGEDQSDGLFKLRIGAASGPKLQWTATALEFYNAANTKTISFDASGNGYFAGVMELGASGGIWQGTGTFASPTTGLKIYRSGSVGLLETYNASVLQVQINTTGKLLGGGGNVYMDADGLTLLGTTTTSDPILTTSKAITFTDVSDGLPEGSIFGYKNTASGAEGVQIQAAGSNLIRVATDGIKIFAGTGDDVLIQTNGIGTGGLLETNGNFYAGQVITAGNGLIAGGGGSLTANTGQIVSDNESTGNNAIILRATGSVAHGITDVVVTETYGFMNQRTFGTGGLNIAGLSEADVGIVLSPYVTTVVTTEATTSVGAMNINAVLKSGTGVTGFAADDNIFTLRSNAQTRVIIKGDGDIWTDGVGTLSTYGEYDDAELIRRIELEMAGQIDRQFTDMLRYNRADVERARLATFDENGGMMVNNTRIQRLLMGNAWQQHGQIKAQEAQIQTLREELSALQNRLDRGQ